MRKALKRSGWLLIATGILALAYYVGNQTGPSVPNEIPSYDPADLAPPTPIAEESSMPDAASTHQEQLTNPNEGRRARIISVTAIHGINQSRKDFPTSLPTIVDGQLPQRRQKDQNNSISDASAKRQGSGTPTPKPHAIVSLSPGLPPSQAPVAPIAKHRPLADEDVAWHVINNPASPHQGVPAAEQFFTRESEVEPSGHSATRGPNLNGPVTASAQLTPTGKIVQARHEEIATHTAENHAASSPVASVPKVKPVIDPPRVLPRLLPDIQAIPLSHEPKRVEISQPREVARAAEPANTKVLLMSKDKQAAPPAAKSPMESIGVVLLESPEEEPRQLPADVMNSAPLMATQKLIARSLGSSDGVAANLAELRPDRPESSAGVVLTGAVMEDNGLAKPYTTTGVVNFRTSKEEIAAQAHLDYVTSGLVILPSTEEPTISPPLAIQERLLKNAIGEACGNKVRNLEVVLEPNHSLKIRLLVANEADRQRLTQTILTLPALSSYHITLSVQVLSEM